MNHFEKYQKITNTIPTQYRWNGTLRFVSPQGQEISKKDLKDIQCPNCHKFALINRKYNVLCLSGYMVSCNACEWMPKIYLEECPDDNTALEEFKVWLEAYELLDQNPDCLSLDTRQFLYDENDLSE